MRISRLLPFMLAPSMIVAPVLLTVVGVSLASPDRPATEPNDHRTEDSLTGIWRGAYVNQHDVASKAYLDISEHTDGTLSGRWGNGPKGALTIEHGERVTKEIFQWEVASPSNEKGRYRIRATLKGNTLQLDITYTWRESGKVHGLTAVSTLTRE